IAIAGGFFRPGEGTPTRTGAVRAAPPLPNGPDLGPHHELAAPPWRPAAPTPLESVRLSVHEGKTVYRIVVKTGGDELVVEADSGKLLAVRPDAQPLRPQKAVI